MFLGETKPSAPHKYGYKKSHNTAAAALRAAQESHLAFCMLMGYCGYCMATHTNMYCNTGPNGYSDFKQWWELDLAKHHVPHNIIDLVHNSELNLFNASYPWAGVVVYHNCLMLAYISELMKWDVPVWIYWGSIDGPYHSYNNNNFKFLPSSQDEITKGVHLLKHQQP